jgi:hypothetical protein
MVQPENRMDQYKFWVAEDGSTYPAFKYDTDEDGFINTGQVRLSAEYAMHYEEAFVLAQPVSAYDARKESTSGTDKQKHEAARSPAVNRGTDDAYGYDSTSTQATVIDLGQQDIGYHYYRRIADDDPLEDDPNTPEVEGQNIEISFRPPKVENIPIIRYIVSVLRAGSMNINYDQSKDVVTEPLDYFDPIERGSHTVEVISDNGFHESENPAVINLVVDPDPPEVE